MNRTVIFHPNASKDYKLAIYWQDRCSTYESKCHTLQKENSSLYTQLLLERQKRKELEERLAEFENLPAIIDALKKDNKDLCKKLNLRNKKKEEPYGKNTSSSKRTNKPQSSKDNQNKKGGGQQGHKGHGRQLFPDEEADDIVILPAEENTSCVCCHGELVKIGEKKRYVMQYEPAKVSKIIYKRPQYSCTSCNKIQSLKPLPNVMPHYKYDNSFIAQLMVEHFFYHQTAGQVCKRFNISLGVFYHIAHRVAKLLREVIRKLEIELLNARVMHADETIWVTDGAKSWAFGFFTKEISIFKFRHTRGKIVPFELFGNKSYNGVLCRDRYAGYNFINMKQQYCYAHLIRNIETIQEEFKGEEDEEEVNKFADDLIPLLVQAIKLRKKKLPDKKHKKEGCKIRDNIIKIIESEAKSPGVKNIQSIFRESYDRLYQWVESAEIPAENNFAERAWRSTVIARKTSFGSQSEKGRLTREVIMSFLFSMQGKGFDPAKKLLEFLNFSQNSCDIAKNYSY